MRPLVTNIYPVAVFMPVGSASCLLESACYQAPYGGRGTNLSRIFSLLFTLVEAAPGVMPSAESTTSVPRASGTPQAS